jgi:hypothetical protein
MAMHPNILIRAVVVATALALCPAFVQTIKAEPTLSEEEVQNARDGGIPSPGPLFSALSHSLPEINWQTVSKKTVSDPSFTKTNYKDDATRAANLGTRVAAAFIAVQAKDVDSLRKAGKAAYDLGESFGGVTAEMKSVAEKLKSASDSGDWNQIPDLVEQLARVSEGQIMSSGHREEAVLAFSSGWLTLLDIVTSALSDSYSDKGSLILRQASIAQQLLTQVQNLPDKAKAEPAVKAQLEALQKIAGLMDGDRQTPVPKDTVTQLHDLSSAAVKQIEG